MDNTSIAKKIATENISLYMIDLLILCLGLRINTYASVQKTKCPVRMQGKLDPRVQRLEQPLRSKLG